MSSTYRIVQWNRHKRVYDVVLACGVVVLLVVFVVVSKMVLTGEHAVSDEVLILRALGICAIVLLHVTLLIGPLARLTPRCAALLYNRRHLGVTTFCLALAHALLATIYYGGFSGTNPLLSILNYGSFRSVSAFPFEWFGLLALLILFVMAATSHDFWLVNLGAKFWKWLHMSVYVAYAAIVLHVALGALQSERHLVLAILIIAGALLLATLHAIVGIRQLRADSQPSPINDEAIKDENNDQWIDAASIDEIPESRAKVVHLAGSEPIALFRNNDTFSAVTNVCAHQGGPLGEGKIVGGCITCPWHGYQYLPHNGQSPPPFVEKIATYEVRVRGDRVEVRAKALPPGTPVVPAPRTCAKPSFSRDRSKSDANPQESGS